MLSIQTNKKSLKGFSLIELLVTLGILSMVVGSILLSSSKVSKFGNSLQVESCKNNIIDLFGMVSYFKDINVAGVSKALWIIYTLFCIFKMLRGVLKNMEKGMRK